MARRALAKYTVKEKLYAIQPWTIRTPTFFHEVSKQVARLDAALSKVPEHDFHLDVNNMPDPVQVELNGYAALVLNALGENRNVQDALATFTKQKKDSTLAQQLLAVEGEAASAAILLKQRRLRIQQCILSPA